jgi:hypothetical protein
LSALETVILDNHRDDDRLTIVSGRETITINADTYENLKSVGVQTTVTEKRNKLLKEFDIDIQEMILSNEENYTKKVSKESVRVKKQ